MTGSESRESTSCVCSAISNVAAGAMSFCDTGLPSTFAGATGANLSDAR
jgi:hypothetical protein